MTIRYESRLESRQFALRIRILEEMVSAGRAPKLEEWLEVISYHDRKRTHAALISAVALIQTKLGRAGRVKTWSQQDNRELQSLRDQIEIERRKIVAERKAERAKPKGRKKWHDTPYKEALRVVARQYAKGEAGRLIDTNRLEQMVQPVRPTPQELSQED